MNVVCSPEFALAAHRMGGDVLVVTRLEHLDGQHLGNVVYVWGGARLFAWVAHCVSRQGREQTTRLVAVAPPAKSPLAASDLAITPRQMRACIAGRAHVIDHEVTSLQVTFSGFAARELCFGVVLGGWSEPVAAEVATGSGVAAFAVALSQQLKPRPEVAFVVDGESGQSRGLYVCAVRRGNLGLRFRHDGPSYLANDAPLGSLPGMLGLSSWGKLLAGDAQEFRRIHVDVTSDYVIDDESYPTLGAQALVIEPGPVFRLGA